MKIDNNLKRLRTVYSLKLARQLKKHGFEPIGLGQNPEKQEFVTWIFEDSPELEMAIFNYTSAR
ncbi:hypothetical protein H7U34_01915 [Collinsella tanakaei]|nr:hypothetical protein [Collinsella tanakaei]